MDRPEHIQHSTAIAWVILGYLAANPNAKDTAEGVTRWWLNGNGSNHEVNVVRGSLQYLVRLGWLTYTKSKTGCGLYGLCQTWKSTLEQFLHSPVRFN